MSTEDVKRYLENMGFKARPEHKEITQEHFEELLKKPEFRSMIDAYKKGQISIDVVKDRTGEPEPLEEYVVLDEQAEIEPEAVMIPKTKPISARPELPKTEPLATKTKSKQRVGKTTIQIDDDIAESIKKVKGKKTFNQFLRELLK